MVALSPLVTVGLQCGLVGSQGVVLELERFSPLLKRLDAFRSRSFERLFRLKSRLEVQPVLSGIAELALQVTEVMKMAEESETLTFS